MDKIPLRNMTQRDYRMIPVDQIQVVMSRTREKKQFEENVRSIGEMGLYKPILVNKRNLPATGKYDLICGEGRLLDHIQLGKTHIRADIVDVEDAQAHLMTLGENIARTRRWWTWASRAYRAWCSRAAIFTRPTARSIISRPSRK